jgi:hypothetical protein
LALYRHVDGLQLASGGCDPLRSIRVGLTARSRRCQRGSAKCHGRTSRRGTMTTCSRARSWWVMASARRAVRLHGTSVLSALPPSQHERLRSSHTADDSSACHRDRSATRPTTPPFPHSATLTRHRLGGTHPTRLVSIPAPA